MTPFTITAVDWHLKPEEYWEIRREYGELYLTSPHTNTRWNITQFGIEDLLKQDYPELFIDIQPLYDDTDIPF